MISIVIRKTNICNLMNPFDPIQKMKSITSSYAYNLSFIILCQNLVSSVCILVLYILLSDDVNFIIYF